MRMSSEGTRPAMVMPVTIKTPSAPNSSTRRRNERRIRLCMVGRTIMTRSLDILRGDVGDVHIHAHGLIQEIQQKRAAQPGSRKGDSRDLPKIACRTLRSLAKFTSVSAISTPSSCTTSAPSLVANCRLC